jgi:alkanesulfonate monooxygenase SsuD/methylene tetrahydromethanopterin reductase-like flavin-dependent oxidoreductase (luciferase family)
VDHELEKFRVGLFVGGLFGPEERPTPDRETVCAAHDVMFAEGVAAEEVGFEGLFVGEQHGRTECFFPDVLLLLGIMAAKTESIRLAPFCHVLTLWDPMHVAETLALVDQVSRGRLTYSPGMGYHPGYFNHFGINEKNRLSLFTESIEIIKKAWTSEEPFSFEGKRFKYDDVFLTPKPYQDPHPVIWGAGQSDAAIERSGTYATGWCGDPFPLDRDVFMKQTSAFKEKARENGVDDPKVILMRNGFVADTREEAEEAFGKFYIDEMRFYYDYGIFSHDPNIQSREDVNVENLRSSLVIGTPEDCIESLEKFRDEYEADYVVMRFRMNDGPTPERSMECIRQFGEQVLPHFHADMNP